jgi:hypothetical protein
MPSRPPPLRLPYYWFADHAMRSKYRIPHYLMGGLVRYRLSELSAWATRSTAEAWMLRMRTHLSRGPNDRFQRHHQTAEHDRESQRDEIRAELIARLESVLTTMFPAGKKRRGKFLIGDILGSPGDSLGWCSKARRRVCGRIVPRVMAATSSR